MNKNLTFTAPPGKLLENILLLLVAQLTIVFIAQTYEQFFKWISRYIIFNNDGKCLFKGKANDIRGYAIVQGICSWLAMFLAIFADKLPKDISWQSFSPFVLSLLFVCVLSCYSMYKIYCWVIANATINNENSFRFNGSFLEMMGFYVLMILVSLVPWIGNYILEPLVFVFFVRWFMSKIEHKKIQFSFQGRYWPLIWLNISTFFGCLLIVTIPKRIKIYFDWYFDNTNILFKS